MAPIGGLYSAFGALLLLVLLVSICRKQWLAIVVLGVLHFSILSLRFIGEPSMALLGTAAIAAIIVICISRFGLLAMVSFQVVFTLSFHSAITANVSRWYFVYTVFTAIFLVAIAIYGFYTSLAKQPLAAGKFLRELDG
jgi:hypothetical protein